MAARAAFSYQGGGAPDDQPPSGAATSPLHPLVNERVLTLALCDARNFAIRRLRRSLGPVAQTLCAELAQADQPSALVNASCRASALLLERLGEYEARAFIAALRVRLAYANPSWPQLLDDVPIPARVTLL